MLSKITEEELEFCEDLCDPVATVETLFSDLESLYQFKASQFGSLWNFQLSMLSYEYLVDEDKKLSKQENFRLKEGAGAIYNFGGRGFGKTLITLLCDMALSVIHLKTWKTLFSSYDAGHIRKVLNDFIHLVENHPFFRMFKVKSQRSPSYLIKFRNGFQIDGINQNRSGKDPGGNFFGHHPKKHWQEEASKEIKIVKSQRVDAVHPLGCINRFSGMTDFTKASPAGEVYYDLARKNWICNYPQFVNPLWDAKKKAEKIKEHQGESSIGYRMFCKGEIVEDMISVFDPERLKACFNDKKVIKHLEVDKKSYPVFKDILILERPQNAEVLYIAADIGESAPSEIIIISKVNNNYKYLYNITLYSLTDKEQYLVFLYLINKLKANFIGLDCTEGTGRAIYRRLAEVYDKKHLCWVGFNEKIAVDFDKDEKEQIIFKDGKPVYKEEYITEWSVKRLRDLFYNERIRMPLDYKLSSQLSSLVCFRSGNRTLYKIPDGEDHLLAAFEVWAIMEWNNEFNILKPMSNKKFSKKGFWK